MSALARYFRGLGCEIHGYDKTETTLTKTLVAEGMYIHYTDDVSLIPEKVDLVVYTPAVPKDHGELNYFFASNIPVKKRSEVLGLISQNRRMIAVAGTHGKTTTSTILTHLLRVAEIDCTAFLGGIAQNYASNFVAGQSEWVVAEADEYDRSFLQLYPDYAIILSMDADHLDIYGDHDQMAEGFTQFAAQIKPGGTLFLRDGLKLLRPAETEKTFGLERGEYRAENIRVEDGYFVFDYVDTEGRIDALRFTLPGRHNVENATAAIAIARQLNASPTAIREALQSFRGIKRRFELVCRTAETVFIDDYAHHPTELQAAIAAARELHPGKKISGVFQPHLYSRTRDFADGFAAALDELDELFLLDIYPARELPIAGVDSAMILQRMQNPNRQLVTKANLMSVLQPRRFEVLLTLGAGDIDTMVSPIKEWITNDR